MCGASANAWLYKTTVSCGRAERHLNTPTRFDSGKQEYTWQVNDLLNQVHPNLVIVEAADAIGGYDSPDLPKAWIYDQVHTLALKIQSANASCVWVGPVYGDVNSVYRKADDRVRGVSAFLSQSVAPCLYVDSLKFEPMAHWSTTDGQHLNDAGYRAWGVHIADAVIHFKPQNQLQ